LDFARAKKRLKAQQQGGKSQTGIFKEVEKWRREYLSKKLNCETVLKKKAGRGGLNTNRQHPSTRVEKKRNGSTYM